MEQFKANFSKTTFSSLQGASMDRIERILSFLNQDIQDVPSRIFMDYRIWICMNFHNLLYGEKKFWGLFQQCRSRLLGKNGFSKERFAWEAAFLSKPPQRTECPRTLLCKRIGLSPATLRSYEDLGMFSSPTTPSDVYGKEKIKRLQWILFFLRELGFRPGELAATLSLPPVRGQLDVLSRSADPHLPVHLSAPLNDENPKENQREEGFSSDLRRERDLLHDMGNRIHIIAGRANLLRRKMAGNDVAERNLSIILSQSQQADKILNELRKKKSASF